LRNRILFLLAFCGLIASASAQSTFNRFNFTAGLGEGIGRDDVASYVGNSFQGVAGAGINFTRMFGIDAEYMYYSLDFRPSVELSQSLNNQSGNMQSISLDGIVNVPRHLQIQSLWNFRPRLLSAQRFDPQSYARTRHHLSAGVAMVGPDLGEQHPRWGT